MPSITPRGLRRGRELQEVPLLSLARRPGQKIRIGEDVVIVVREIRGRQVKLGIEAPPTVRVLREEIHEELVAANLRAAEVREVPAALRSGDAE